MERLSGGAYAAMITPFTKDDKVNEGAIEQLIEYGLAGGLAGFYLTGSTGEGLLMSVAERSRAVERRKVVVASRDYATEIFFDEFGVFLDGIADGAEDDAHFHELFLVARVNADGIEHGIDGHVGKALLFVQRDAEFFKSRQEFRIDIFDLFVALLGLRCGVIDDVLQVNRIEVELAPVGLFHRLELFVSLQAKIEHELRFATER
ncbi:MAG: dihydrodipicolinate synthase family protein [Fibrobacter sp.]|nr:dihydrodipicolinate synthase family protein [Fibrobacter sp.]